MRLIPEDILEAASAQLCSEEKKQLNYLPPSAYWVQFALTLSPEVIARCIALKLKDHE